MKIYRPLLITFQCIFKIRYKFVPKRTMCTKFAQIISYKIMIKALFITSVNEQREPLVWTLDSKKGALMNF